MLGYTFVDTFVAAADEEEFVELSVVAGEGLVEFAALGREEDDAAVRISELPAGEDPLHGFKDRLAFEEHAFPAPERAVVDGAVAVVGPIAEVVDFDIEETVAAGAGDDAVVDRAGEEAGEDREDVEGQVAYRL